MSRSRITADANHAVASVAYRTHEVIPLYPITPATPMGELCDVWRDAGRTNLWGEVPEIVALHSDAGAAGTLHGALQAGALATTFTASQGLLQMIPEMYRIAGGLLPVVIHVAARAVASHGHSIYGDHSDVYTVRTTGWAMLASSSVQEAQDLAAIAQATALASRIPVLHFFDGFRTSHELRAIVPLEDDELRALLNEEHLLAHRERALSPRRPEVRGTLQGSDVFFQAREAANSAYASFATAFRAACERFAELTGRAYGPFARTGDAAAERVVVAMGSAAETAAAVAEHHAENDERTAAIKVRLYRPFDATAFNDVLPRTAAKIAVLDRTKEPGAPGEPLYLDISAALRQAPDGARGEVPITIGGRYGLGGKELRPGDVGAVFDELAEVSPRHGFTVGLVDDVTGLSLPTAELDLEDPEAESPSVRAVLFALGHDGTVAAAKRALEIVGNSTELDVQGHFDYDIKKAGATTVSHLRLSPRPIRAPYRIRRASFLGCHHLDLLDRFGVLEIAEPGATVLLNAPGEPEEIWARLSRESQAEILAKKLRVHVIDADEVARRTKLRGPVGDILSTCFFALAGILPRDEAIAGVRRSIEESFAGRGPVVVRLKLQAVDEALEHLRELSLPETATSERHRARIIAAGGETPWTERLVALLRAGKGDALPVSAFPVDGVWPIGERHATPRDPLPGTARQIPIWQSDVCIECNQCVLACPHAALRAKVVPPATLDDAPDGFRQAPSEVHGLEDLAYILQVVPDDCTGCGLCIEVCPARDQTNPRLKAIHPEPVAEHLERERRFLTFFESLPETIPANLPHIDAETSQFLEPRFVASGACPGCGETPYLELLSRLFGDRLMIANATGCSSSYGGDLASIPWAAGRDGRGPTWSHSLFEDAAELGLGFRLAIDVRTRRGEIPSAEDDRPSSLWIVGGDGWAYDIGAAGLEHVLASGRNVNVLVLDNEVYALTGGQRSKATPRGAAAKFEPRGKTSAKEDLGREMMGYENVYVARIAFGANMNQAVEALLEADAYDGPSLVIAYSPCVAHGYDLAFGVHQQKRAVASGVWPLDRFDPRRKTAGEPALHLDAPPPSERIEDYVRGETRFRLIEKLAPDRFRRFLRETRAEIAERQTFYRKLAEAEEKP